MQKGGEEVQVRLEIEYTDLDVKEERNLRKYILYKANRNLIYTSGQIGILPTFVSKSKISGTSICYFCLVEFEAKSSQRKEEATSEVVNHSENQESNVGTIKKQEYIICLICEVENDEGFALYLSFFTKIFLSSLIYKKI
jgi:hypothetical protein